ncbi:glycosyltransferase family 39 protein [Rurimicrobium arvi]|uniref:Glycosyltransferase RgtA/B/C/D-like domain-containing protein n=1 Tax=Rurimicrobium arvi TaxID=2049916 RepID=A0ABP8MKZ0_9BACT
MKHGSFIAFGIECFFRAVLAAVLGIILWYLFSNTYLEILSGIRRQLYLDVTDAEGKSSDFLLVILWFARLLFLALEFLAIKKAAEIITGYCNGLYKPAAFSLYCAQMGRSNQLFIVALPRGIRYLAGFLLLLYTCFLLYGITHLPSHYDEVFTYRFFSGKGLLASLAFYPLPNNHILFNLFSAVPLLLPVNVLIAIRIVSVLAALAGIYYFFRLSCSLFPASVALVCSVLLAFSLPVLLYATQARGYALMLLFAVLCIYAVLRIAAGEDRGKYFFVYTFSSVLGLFTIPSFLYCLVVTSTVLLVVLCRHPSREHIRQFVVSHLLVPATTLLLYLPVILRNGKESLYKNNGITPRDITYLKNNLNAHLHEIWDFFTGADPKSFVLVWCILGVVLLTLFTAGVRQRWAAFLVLLFLLSPVPVVFVHRVIPFTRTWIHLIIPLCLGAGFLLNGIRRLALSYAGQWAGKLSVAHLAAFTLLPAIICAARFIHKHAESNAIDYVVAHYCKRLEPKFSLASSVAHTPGDMSFYLAETLAFECNEHNAGAPFSLNQISGNAPVNADIVVLDKQRLPEADMSGYRLLPDDNPFFAVYIRQGF